MTPRLCWLLCVVVLAYVFVSQSNLGDRLGRSGRLMVGGAGIVLVIVVEVVAARKSPDDEG